MTVTGRRKAKMKYEIVESLPIKFCGMSHNFRAVQFTQSIPFASGISFTEMVSTLTTKGHVMTTAYNQTRKTR